MRVNVRKRLQCNRLRTMLQVAMRAFDAKKE
jgi:hypothetical protein